MRVRSLAPLVCLVCLTGWAFAAEKPGAVLLRVDFDSAQSLDALKAKRAGDVKSVPGKVGAAMRFGKGRLVIPLPRALPAKGSIEYWVRTHWPAKKSKTQIGYFEINRKQPDGRVAYLGAWATGARYGFGREMSVPIDEDLKYTRLRFIQRRLACSLWDQGPEDWYKVTIRWDLSKPGNGTAALCVNEVLKDRLDGLALKPEELGARLVLGSLANGHVFEMDEFTIREGEKHYAQDPARNLLPNPGFEEHAADPAVPAIWTPVTGVRGPGYWGGPRGCKPAERGVNTWVKDNAYSGARAVSMEGFHAGVGGQIIGSGIRGFTPGKVYRVDGAVRSFHPKTLTPILRVVPWDRNRKVMRERVLKVALRVPEQNAGRWLSINDLALGKNVFTPPVGCRSISLYLHTRGKGKVLWDDVYLGQAEKP